MTYGIAAKTPNGILQLISSRATDSLYTTISSATGTSVELQQEGDIVLARIDPGAGGDEELCWKTSDTSYPYTYNFVDTDANSQTADYIVLRPFEEFTDTITEANTEYGLFVFNTDGNIQFDTRRIDGTGGFGIDLTYEIGELLGSGNPPNVGTLLQQWNSMEGSIIDGQQYLTSSTFVYPYVEMTLSYQVTEPASRLQGNSYVGYRFVEDLNTGVQVSGFPEYFSGVAFIARRYIPKNTYTISENFSGFFAGRPT